MDKIMFGYEGDYLKQEFYKLMNSNPALVAFLEELTLVQYWYWDIDSPDAQWMNLKLWEKLGYDAQNFEQASSEWRNLIKKEDLTIATDAFNRFCYNLDHSYDQTIRYQHKDKSTVWIRSTAYAIRDNQGRAVKIIGVHVDVTELKTMQSELSEAVWRFKALFEKGPIGVAYHRIIYDNTGKPIDYYFIDANSNYKELTGVDPTGLMVTEAFPGIENDPFDWIGVFGNVAKNGETVHFEQYLESNKRWYDCVAYQHKPDHFVVTFTEITTRKLAEVKITETTERFQQISETVEEVFYLVTPDNTELLYINSAYEVVYGRSCQSLYDNPLSFLELVYEADRKRVYAEFQKSMGTGFFDQEYRILRPDGSLRWVKSRSFPIKDEKGIVVRHAGTAVDITEYKNIEEKLSKNLKDLLESQRIAHIGTWRLDVDSNQVVWSEELYKMYGFDPMLPIPPYTEHMKLFTPESWERLSTALEKTRVLGIPYELELETVTKEGSNGWMWVRGEAEYSSEGHIVAIWGAAQDISEQKAIELDLIKAKEAAEAANASKSQFLSNMSHEIRTPMNGFMGMLHLLQNTPLTKEQLELIDIAKNASDSLLTLVNDILDYSKIEAGKMNFEDKPFEFRELIADTVNLFKIPAHVAGLALNVVITDDIPMHVSGDAFRLKQVLSNLLGNAIKFTKSGGVVLDVKRLEWHENTSIKVQFEIADTGIGIAPEQLGHMFTRFYQIDETSTREYGGSGLGLSICKGLVERMGGSIWVESQVDVGSHFYFTSILSLPQKVSSASNIHQGKSPEKHKRVTILLAEDDAVNRIVIQKVALKKGWHVTLTENGQQAVDAFKQSSFDLILMDVQMPVMNGYQATKIIRSIEQSRNTHTPIIALTAMAIEGDLEKCIAAGMDDYLAKPLDFSVFYAMVQKWLD